MRFFFIVLITAALFACSKPVELKTGAWRGVISLQGKELPFFFEIEKTEQGYRAYLLNVTERILLDEVTVSGDSVKMVLHIFDADLRARINGDQLSGTFYKNYAPQANQPFSATFEENYLFTKDDTATIDYTGKYQLEFTTAKDTYPSVGVFEQTGNHVTGTFLTPMGDYRYLDGNVVDGKLMLGTFDGNHAFLFIGSVDGDSLKGDYYSGKSAHETFKGVKDDNAKMPDMESLTYLKEGYDRIDFSFPDVTGKKITPGDDRFANKVLILQIFGTWCPNCMDETKFLSAWYPENRNRGVEILGLAYERKDDFEYAVSRINKMKEKLGVPYDFVIAGVNDKEKAAETLPMLNKVIAFPTTIFIGKDGKVKRIHTGFDGPGTGIYHERFKERFNQIVNELLSENIASATGNPRL